MALLSHLYDVYNQINCQEIIPLKINICHLLQLSADVFVDNAQMENIDKRTHI